jgi:hypothetical protein
MHVGLFRLRTLTKIYLLDKNIRRGFWRMQWAMIHDKKLTYHMSVGRRTASLL